MQKEYVDSASKEIRGFSKKSGYEFLSNFYAATVAFEGSLYPSVEHAYQAAKSLDVDTRKIIKRAMTSGEAKRLGRAIVVRPDWIDVRLDIMRNLIREKFENPFLRFRLKDTYGYKIINESRYDKFWGIVGGEGENWLGRIIEEVREKIIADDELT